jgi:c-di-GMP-binding flagellar brake protein YcgR
MDRRRNRRVAAFLTVRIWGVDAKRLPFAQHAQVRNISDGGAVLHGMIRPVKAGEILYVQHDEDQAQFRVVWVGKPGTSRQSEIGIESLPSEPSIWDVNLLHCGQLVGKG